MTFDPDKYLADKKASGEFNPDAYLASKQPEAQEEPSMTGSALRGVVQGAAMSGSPIIAGVEGALADLLGRAGVEEVHSPNPEVEAKLEAQRQEASKSLLDKYRQYRDEYKAQLAKDIQTNPISSISGELAGGLLPGGALVKGMSKANLLLKPLEGAKDLSRLEKVSNAARIGAVSGGVASGLGGEADLTKGEVGKLTEDVAHGAETGAVLGGVVEGGIQSLGATKDKISDLLAKTKLGRQAQRSYELGEMGQGISSEESQQKFAKRLNNEAQKVVDTLLDSIENNFKKKTEMLKGKSINMDDFLQTTEDTINNAVDSFQLEPDQAEVLRQTVRQNLYKKLPDSIKKIIRTTVTEGEDGPMTKSSTTYKGKEKLTDLIKNAPGEEYTPQSSQVTASPKTVVTSETSGNVGETLGDVDATKAAQIIRNLQNQAFAQRIANPGKSATMKDIAYQGSQLIKNQFPETQVPTQQMSTAIETLDQLGQPELIRSLGKKQASDQTIDFIKKFGSKTPKDIQQRENIIDMLTKLNPDYAKRFADRASKIALDQSLVETAEKQGLTLSGQVLGSVKSAGLKGLNLAGQTKRIAEMPADKVKAFSRSLAQSNNPNAQKLAGMLDAAFTASPERRGATLFAISQNKDFRDLMNGLLAPEGEVK